MQGQGMFGRESERAVREPRERRVFDEHGGLDAQGKLGRSGHCVEA